jgi:hypothetical protein
LLILIDGAVAVAAGVFNECGRLRPRRRRM